MKENGEALRRTSKEKQRPQRKITCLKGNRPNRQHQTPREGEQGKPPQEKCKLYIYIYIYIYIHIYTIYIYIYVYIQWYEITTPHGGEQGKPPQGLEGPARRLPRQVGGRHRPSGRGGICYLMSKHIYTVYIYIYIHRCVCTYIYIYMFIYLCICIYVCIYIYIYTHMWMNVRRPRGRSCSQRGWRRPSRSGTRRRPSPLSRTSQPLSF